MPESFREEVDIASAIKGILDTYPSNSILREILQNSDDAGATEQIFILDHRQHRTSSIVDKALSRTQGPALLAVNNGIFTESDWKAVSTIHGSNKSADETKTGKYGLGIRATYHITDNLQILSGDKLIIFDPHKEFGEFKGGASISLGDETDNYVDQLDAFSAAFSGSNTPSYFSGTVIRLPLRTPASALRSRIKSTAVTASLMSSLFQAFIEKELGVALLFLKHISMIELREIDVLGNSTIRAKVYISNPVIPPSRAFPPNTAGRSDSFQLDIITQIDKGAPISQSWCLFHHARSDLDTTRSMTKLLGYDIGDRLKKDKLSSHLALAFPLSHRLVQGQLFTLLPLPISTGLPLHVHAIFALTPDRQSLRNSEELGIGMQSRERLLVTWNQMIFTDLLPTAWALLLNVLAQSYSIADPWSAWPPECTILAPADKLLSNVTQATLVHGHRVFPLVGDERVFVGVDSPALIAGQSVGQKLVEEVSRTGISVINPPPHIYRSIQHAHERMSNFRFFDGENLHGFLQEHLFSLQSLSDDAKDDILEYLIVASPLYIVGLPLIRSVSGDRLALSTTSAGRFSMRYILATANEVMLFGSCDPNMIPLADLTAQVRSKLTANRNGLNVAKLAPGALKEYLVRIFGIRSAHQSLPLSPTLPSLSWFCNFWEWIDKRSDPTEYLEVSKLFHLLPLSDNTLRNVTNKAFMVVNQKRELLEMLSTNGVPILHSSLDATTSLSAHRLALTITDIPALLGFIDPSISHSTDRILLQNHIIENIPWHRPRKIPSLDSKQRTVLHLLPVFPTRVPSPSSPTPHTCLSSATGKLLFIHTSDDFPLPVLPNMTYIDTSDPSSIVASLLDSIAFHHPLNEHAIMDIAIDNLTAQPEILQDALMLKTIPRLFELSQESQQKLRSQKFISTVGSGTRVCGQDVIDPDSPLADLFTDEPGRFPRDQYAEDRFLSVMRSTGLCCTALSPAILLDRIVYISGSSVSLKTRFFKAKCLLGILSKSSWNSSFASILQTDAHTAWLPTTSMNLAPRQHCRAKKSASSDDDFLFDQVLDTVACTIPEHIQTVLGWDSMLAFDILEQQFRSTLDRIDLPLRPKRLLHFIQYLSEMRSQDLLTMDDIFTLQSIVRDRDWIPRSDSTLASTSTSLLAVDLRIGKTFQSIPIPLQDTKTVQFLREMGCSERPTVAALVAALNGSLPLDEMVALLTELSLSHIGEVDNSQRQRILVIDQTFTTRNLSEVYYNDLGQQGVYVPLKDELFPVHSAISKMVASGLTIPFLSSLQLDNEDELDVDDEDMSESFVTRIRSVLIEYDIHYSFNEFLANASDARATRFEVLLDTKSFELDRILCPEMDFTQRGPAMVLFNDATFSVNDFRGIRNIGEGGKQNIEGTIGKFGLGALSFYHFSEVAFIVSGEHVMVLDPSSSYLPKRRGRTRRSVWLKLRDFNRRYPDHLAPLDGIFGFSSNMNEYSGTLIRLPLRLPAQSTYSRLSNDAVPMSRCRDLLSGTYQSLSRTAPLFTGLCHIVARERREDGRLIQLWAIQASGVRNADCEAENTSETAVTLSYQAISEVDSRQRWFIVKDTVPLAEIPSHFLPIISQLKASARISIGVAFLLDQQRSSASKPQYHLFSGVQLPVVLSLPAHFDAAFVVSNDRRGIRLDPPDSDGKRVLQSEYNSWLLCNSLPLLYLRGLQSLITQKYLSSVHGITEWWPKEAKDHVSEQFVQAFYALLPETELRVLPTVTGSVVSPRDAIISYDEPSQVRKLLSDCLEVPNFVILRFATGRLLPKDRLPMLDAESLAAILQQSTVEERLHLLVQREAEKRTRVVHRLPSSTLPPETTIITMIESALKFLIEGKSTVGPNLRLLVTDDLTLRRFTDNSPTFHSALILSQELFPPSEFLYHGISEETRNLLNSDSSYRVQEFDYKAVVSFVERFVGRPRNRSLHSPTIVEWIDLFWKGFNLWRPLDLDTEKLAAYPLFPTLDGSVFVSLEYSRSGHVLPDPGNPEMQQVIRELGIPVLRDHPILSKADDPHLKFSFETLLRCLREKGEGLFDNLVEWLAQWIIRHMLDNLHSLDSTLLTFMSKLPLWTASKDGKIQRLSAEALTQIPLGIDLVRVHRFLDPARPIAQYANELQRLWMALNDGRRTLPTYENFRAMLSLPFSLSPGDIDDYRYLLDKLIRNSSNFSGLKVPDGHLVLRPPRELFISSNELFAAAFHYNQNDMFVHPQFRDVEESVGVTNEVSLETFLRCAGAIHDDQDHGLTHQIQARADTIYAYYSNQLPQQIMADTYSWNRLNNVCFIPRNTSPPEGLTYDSTLYHSRIYPALVSPSQLLRAGFLSVAWTQRSRFTVEPSQNLIAVHPKIGEPTVEDVVAHLVVLATQVARDHEHDRTLVRDLKATYRWLKENASSAKTSLQQHKHERIFLNVININMYQESWQWRSANELILNLEYDSPKLFKVQPFLSEFKELLAAAGARKRVDVTHEDEVQFGDANFERLRASGKLLDIELRPETLLESVGLTVDSSRLKAHAAFLAAHVPYIEDALTGGWNETGAGTLAFPGSYFAACAFLDILYTGDLKDNRPENDKDAMELLTELLKMLQIADIWDLPAMKKKLGWLITTKYLFIQPDTLEAIQHQASEFNAPDLIRACRDFEEKNATILEDLS